MAANRAGEMVGRDGLAVQSSGCSSRESGFNSQPPLGSQMSVTPVPWALTFACGLPGYQTRTGTHTHMKANTHTHRKILKTCKAANNKKQGIIFLCFLCFIYVIYFFYVLYVFLKQN